MGCFQRMGKYARKRAGNVAAVDKLGDEFDSLQSFCGDPPGYSNGSNLPLGYVYDAAKYGDQGVANVTPASIARKCPWFAIAPVRYCYEPKLEHHWVYRSEGRTNRGLWNRRHGTP